MDKLIAFSLRQKYLVLFATVTLLAAGLYSFHKLPIDAFPDVTTIQVQVISKAPGMSPLEVEQLVTFPLEVEFMGLPKKTELRSTTRFGLSVVTVVFEDGTDIYWARQVVLERLIQAKEKLPKTVSTSLGPVATGLGEVYQYTLKQEKPAEDKGTNGGPLNELRTAQDWIIRPMLRTVAGVADVNSLGGLPKQYEVLADPVRLKKYGLVLRDVLKAIEENNANVGGGYIRHQQESYAIRGVGIIKSVQDIEEIAVASIGGTPILLKDVADVRLGSRARLGGVTSEGKGEVVEGIVLMLMGGNSRDIVGAVKERVKEVNRVLPSGISISPFYDRTELVDKALGTIGKALLEGVFLVVIVLYFFLRNLRGAAVVAFTLPLAVLSTFIIMQQVGLTANLMTLGGLAISLGMIADAAIIQVENVQRHLSEKGVQDPRPKVVLDAVLEVRRPSLFGELIIAVTFIPLLTLGGMEGKMIVPLAFTVVLALLSSLLLSLFVIPVFCLVFLKPGEEHEPTAVKMVMRFYRKALEFVMGRKKRVIAVSGVLLAATLSLSPFIGREFMPTMDEGAIVVNVTRVPSISLEDSLAVSGIVERKLMAFPEVKTVVSRTGTDEIGADPMGPELSDVFVILNPASKWRFKTKNELIGKMRDELSGIPGISFVFSQPIQMRVDELVSGVRAQVAVKLFGDDLATLQAKGAEVMAVMKGIKGAVDVRMQPVEGQYYLEIEADRRAMARYGINVADFNSVVEMIRAGKVATEMMEGQRRFSVLVRFPEELGKNVEAIGDLTVSAPNGSRIPIKQIASIRVVEGPSNINREEGKRRIVIEANVEGRDIGGFVEEGIKHVGEMVKLPAGYYVSWGGQFKNQQQAMKKLEVIIPLSIALIFFLLFSTFNGVRYAAIILLNIPFAMIGGVLSLWLSGQYLSVSASVGFIALFGVAVLNGIVLVSYINQMRTEGAGLEDAIYSGCEKRLRPVLMTALVAILGLVPMLFATGPGAEIQRPLASVVVGGLITSTALTLMVLPAIYSIVEGGKEGR